MKINIKKKVKVKLLWLRSLFLTSSKKIDNIFILTTQKAGSQWIRQLLADPLISGKINLIVYPQHRYDAGEFDKRFPVGTIVPGLYMAYDLYQEIEKPDRYLTFCIMRDPRDIVVSWYYSMLETHEIMGKVGQFRNELKKMSVDEGLHYCIDKLATKFADMRSWLNNSSDENMIILKLEEITQNPEPVIQQIFSRIDYAYSEDEVQQITDKYSKSKVRERDMKRRKDGLSHYRKQSSDHRDVFKDDHYKHFYEVTGNLVEILGYRK